LAIADNRTFAGLAARASLAVAKPFSYRFHPNVPNAFPLAIGAPFVAFLAALPAIAEPAS
jgi:hypothetical protein